MATEVLPLVSHINVIYLYVRDMERSRAFYRGLLGIPLEGDRDWQEATLGTTRFALHLWHDDVGEPSSGTIHLNFEVGDPDAAAARLRAAGFEARETMRDQFGTAFEAVDPDGYRIYLFRPPGQ